MTPQLPIDVDASTGVWRTDGLPMIYLPRHFFVNNHVEVEKALGRAAYAQSLYTAGYRSAHFWCAQESQTHRLSGLAVAEHYLQRLSQRGWGQFEFIAADARSGHAQIALTHSVFVLAQGIAGVPVRHDKLCYLFAGWFAGAMDWVGEDTGARYRTLSAETQCAAEGHSHCVFSVSPLDA
ncbi:4-vinyl reductase [Aquincola sp. S2]|uniref:4-vinyl reductase n=1 Tax=Pseudaquabacterium terrae TaxID=2732868 RepID=A0ABX2EUH6_9BURK|nr:4-vinyl reductase [Aquabacterium terrae]NRF72291.1 4-vinyl reductase [Aquabacterium terrae]